MQALVTRVQDLERLLRQHNVDPGNIPPDTDYLDHSADRTDRKPGGKGRTDSDDPRDWTVDHLVGTSAAGADYRSNERQATTIYTDRHLRSDT